MSSCSGNRADLILVRVGYTSIFKSIVKYIEQSRACYIICADSTVCKFVLLIANRTLRCRNLCCSSSKIIILIVFHPILAAAEDESRTTIR